MRAVSAMIRVPPSQDWRSTYVTLFADASYCSRTKAYGWCFWVKHSYPAQTVIRHGGGIGLVNSNLAELYALEQGIKFILETLPVRDKVVVIESDCTGALQKVKLDQLFLKGAKNAYFKHVKGHQGNKCPRSSVNTTCDKFAREEMYIYRGKADQ